MAIWMLSDPHFGHSVAARSRGFETVEDHDNAILRNLRRKFRTGDTVWWLGDIAFDGWQPRVHDVLWNLPGEHHLVLGNHDRAHPINNRSFDHQWGFQSAGFRSIQTAARLKYKSTQALLSHFPYTGDHAGKADRYEEWRLRDLGIPLIHGHTHVSEKLSFSANGTPQVHVGMDAWDLQPVLIWDAFELIRSAAC